MRDGNGHGKEAPQETSPQRATSMPSVQDPSRGAQRGDAQQGLLLHLRLHCDGVVEDQAEGSPMKYRCENGHIVKRSRGTRRTRCGMCGDMVDVVPLPNEELVESDRGKYYGSKKWRRHNRKRRGLAPEEDGRPPPLILTLNDHHPPGAGRAEALGARHRFSVPSLASQSRITVSPLGPADRPAPLNHFPKPLLGSFSCDSRGGRP